MFTKADLKSLVPRALFERGEGYYEGDAVGRIKQEGDTYKAKVRGTETYRVELTVQPSGPPDIYCDCPYNYGPVCKHGVALGLAVLDLAGQSGAAAPPPPTVSVPAPKPGRRPTRQGPTAPPPASLTVPWEQMLEAAWPLVGDKDKQTYLRYLLHQQPQLIAGFLDSFEFDPLQLLARVSAPRPARPRARTFVEVGEINIRDGHGDNMLAFLLRYDWRTVPDDEADRLAALLVHAARQQPEATLDALMERVEKYLASTQRGPGFYPRLVGWLAALRGVPALTSEVGLFASELWRQYGRRAELREALAEAGFEPLPADEQEAAWHKKEAAQAKAAPKRRGRTSKPK